jgi:cytochrome c oxidase assembly factor CtaG/cytochrome c2
VSAAAHDALPPAPHDLLTAWSADPGVLLAAGVVALLYARGVRPRGLARAPGSPSSPLPGLDRRSRRAGAARVRGAALHGARTPVFGAGLTAALGALVTPLHAAGEALASAHMVQHLLLAGVAAPLLALASPLGVVLRGTPPALRRAGLRGWRRAAPLRRAFGAASHPALAWALHAAAVWAWHLPGAYDAALASTPLHAAEHVTLLGTGLLFWWSVLRPGARRGAVAAAGILPLFAVTVATGGLGALLAFAREPLYAGHLDSAAAWGLSPLEDQQLAGLLMWVPGSLPYAAAAAFLLVRTLRAPARTWRAAAPGLGLLLAGSAVLGSCGQGPESFPKPSALASIGDAARGRLAIDAYGCGACHTIPGVRGATGLVGPPLTRFGRRGIIAGQLPNTPPNLVRWILDPPAVEPGTAMPDLGVSVREARDIAAYLHALR